MFSACCNCLHFSSPSEQLTTTSPYKGGNVSSRKSDGQKNGEVLIVDKAELIMTDEPCAPTSAPHAPARPPPSSNSSSCPQLTLHERRHSRTDFSPAHAATSAQPAINPANPASSAEDTTTPAKRSISFTAKTYSFRRMMSFGASRRNHSGDSASSSSQSSYLPLQFSFLGQIYRKSSSNSRGSAGNRFGRTGSAGSRDRKDSGFDGFVSPVHHVTRPEEEDFDFAQKVKTGSEFSRSCSRSSYTRPKFSIDSCRATTEEKEEGSTGSERL